MRMDGIMTLQRAGLRVNFVYPGEMEKPRGISGA